MVYKWLEKKIDLIILNVLENLSVLREYGSHVIDYFWLTDDLNSPKKIDFQINKLKSNIKFKLKKS